MRIKLDYGKSGLQVELPDRNLLSIATPKTETGIANPDQAIRQKLLAPTGSLPFAELCRARKRACIVVSDKTRPVPNKVLLPPLLEVLDQAGVMTTILIACGMHTPTEGADLDALLGPEIVKKREIINHLGEIDSELVSVGRSSEGVEIQINRHYVESDLRILTGFIEPHFMAGFSGGRKAVCPGLAGVSTMQYAHSPDLLESPFASAGVMENNPFHRFALEAARLAGVDFILNVTINRSKEITGVFAGDLDLAHRQGVEFCRKQSQAKLKREADIVVTSNGGFPLDQDLYQTVKGMVCALPAVRQGGTILIASECSRGIGSEDFRKMLVEMKDPDSFIAHISKPGNFRVDQWEVEELVKAMRKAKVKVCTTGVPADELRQCHVEPVESVEKGIAACLAEYGKDATVNVIPSGPYTLVNCEL